MKIVIFGLTVSSSWGNGHATLWRSLCRALARRGHRVVFFERDVPYYAEHRDLSELEGGELVLYDSWAGALPAARRALAGADAALVTSYCPDGPEASTLVLDSGARVRAFYDLDSPVTLARLEAGEPVPYLPDGGLGGFDLVLSYAGGRALEGLRTRLGARRVAPLYGSVDPDEYRPARRPAGGRHALSYLGTYAEDRQPALDRLLLEPARRLGGETFLIGGSLYPAGFPWGPNVWYRPHVPPADHPAFYAASRLTLNVTREPMVRSGHCPSGRLFEAAAAGAALLTDAWDGLEQFFTPGEEIVRVATTEDVLDAIALPDETIDRIARRARERALDEHTGDRRAAELVALLASVASRHAPTPAAARAAAAET